MTTVYDGLSAKDSTKFDHFKASLEAELPEALLPRIKQICEKATDGGARANVNDDALLMDLREHVRSAIAKVWDCHALRPLPQASSTAVAYYSSLASTRVEKAQTEPPKKSSNRCREPVLLSTDINLAEFDFSMFDTFSAPDASLSTDLHWNDHERASPNTQGNVELATSVNDHGSASAVGSENQGWQQPFEEFGTYHTPGLLDLGFLDPYTSTKTNSFSFPRALSPSNPDMSISCRSPDVSRAHSMHSTGAISITASG